MLYDHHYFVPRKGLNYNHNVNDMSVEIYCECRIPAIISGCEEAITWYVASRLWCMYVCDWKHGIRCKDSVK